MARVEVIGISDWLVYGLRDGVLVFTNTETDSKWLDAPHGGGAPYGTPEHAEDVRFMLDHVAAHPELHWWLVDDLADENTEASVREYTKSQYAWPEGP